MKFDQNFSQISGVDTYPLRSVAILFNPTVCVLARQVWFEKRQLFERKNAMTFCYEMTKKVTAIRLVDRSPKLRRK